MKNNLFFLFGLFILSVYACSKDGNTDILPEPIIPSRPVGIMHITADSYKGGDFMLMFQDDESLEVLYNDKERAFQINQPLEMSITKANELQAKFFSVRSISNVDIYAKTSGIDGWFKLATYDSIVGFQLSKSLIPEIKKGTSVLLESGGEKIIEADCHLQMNDSLKIVCDDPLYEKIATHNKCNWFLHFYGGGDPEFFKNDILPVHAREAIALLSNMTYLYSTKVFEDGLYRLQGELYDDKGVGSWIDVKQLHKKLYAERYLLVKLCIQMGAANTGIYALSEYGWLSHYHDTQDGDATITAFHEFGHCLNYDHTSNMTTGDYNSGYALWPEYCQNLYKQMCIHKELPVWSSRFLKSKENKNCYFYGHGQ